MHAFFFIIALLYTCDVLATLWFPHHWSTPRRQVCGTVMVLGVRAGLAVLFWWLFFIGA